jgi:hypothetical protein
MHPPFRLHAAKESKTINMTVLKLLFLFVVFKSRNSSVGTTVTALSRIQDVAKRQRIRDLGVGGGGVMRLLPATIRHKPPGTATKPRGRQHYKWLGSNQGMSQSMSKRVFKTWKKPSPTHIIVGKGTTKGKGIVVKGKGQMKPSPGSMSTPAPTITPVIIVPDCFSNTTILFYFMKQEANPVASYIYTLCPNTVFDIGFLDEMGECCVRGMYALFTKSKSHIKCGESGSSDNNCTLLGGQVQVASGPTFFDEDVATEVVFQGITFEAAVDTGVLLSHRGDVTFIDCIFKVRKKVHLPISTI